MKILSWLKDYWYIPLMVVGVILAWIGWTVSGGKPRLPPIQKILGEVSAIKAGRLARQVELERGAEAAKAHTNALYAEKRKRLDAEAEAKVKELEDDPVALARYLDRL